ncbi:MAG TPA: hypothetical protein PK158_01945 [Spirochaetota bacterium]|nr:hypothetical protein [Spirochaetota bacterium]
MIRRILLPIILFLAIAEYGQSFDGFYNIQSTFSTYRISEETDSNRFSLSHTFFANHSESFDIFNTSINANAFGKIKSGEDQEADKTKSKFESKITEFYISMGSDSIFFDFGKKHIKTGTALFKSPTYYFDSVSGSTWKRDSNSEKKTKEGTIGLKAEWINPIFTVSEYFSPRITINDDREKNIERFTSEQDFHRSLSSLSFRIINLDASLFFLYTKRNHGTKINSGLTSNISIGESFTFYIDASIADKKYNYLPDDNLYTIEEILIKKPIEASSGISYTIDENNTLYAEYYYNGAGLNKSDYDDALDYMDKMNSFNYGSAALLSGKYGLFNMGKHYVMIRGSFSINDSYDFTAMNILNLYDKSGLFQSEILFDGEGFIITFMGRNYYGRKKTEISYFSNIREASAEFEVYF